MILQFRLKTVWRLRDFKIKMVKHNVSNVLYYSGWTFLGVLTGWVEPKRPLSAKSVTHILQF